MEIQIFSDPICPWCYIGFRNLCHAIETYPRSMPQLKIVWRTFMLNPAMPEGGMDRQEYLSKKFGGEARASYVYGQIGDTARANGLKLRLDDINRTPETRSAHQIIQALQDDPNTAALTADFVECLFQDFFIDGKDISDPETLELALVAANGPPGFAAAVLKDGHYRAMVLQDDQRNRQQGLGGVPGFLIQGQHFVGGAQPAPVFHRLFDIVFEQLSAQADGHSSGEQI